MADKEALGKVKNLGIDGDMSPSPPMCIHFVYRDNFYLK